MNKLEYIIANFPEASHILQTPRVGETVDNGVGLEFELDEFAVFFPTGTLEDVMSERELHYIDTFGEELGAMFFYGMDEPEHIEHLIKEMKDLDGFEIVCSNDSLIR